jgi:hypothetical protein
VLLQKPISVKVATEFSDYAANTATSLRDDRLEGITIGQIWVIVFDPLEMYTRNGQMSGDRRHGPRKLPNVDGMQAKLIWSSLFARIPLQKPERKVRHWTDDQQSFWPYNH